jgi:hypothetical protein
MFVGFNSHNTLPSFLHYPNWNYGGLVSFGLASEGFQVKKYVFLLLFGQIGAMCPVRPARSEDT